MTCTVIWLFGFFSVFISNLAWWNICVTFQSPYLTLLLSRTDREMDLLLNIVKSVFKATWEIVTTWELRTTTSVPRLIQYIEMDLRNKTTSEFRTVFHSPVVVPNSQVTLYLYLKISRSHIEIRCRHNDLGMMMLRSSSRDVSTVNLDISEWWSCDLELMTSRSWNNYLDTLSRLLVFYFDISRCHQEEKYYFENKVMLEMSWTSHYKRPEKIIKSHHNFLICLQKNVLLTFQATYHLLNM